MGASELRVVVRATQMSVGSPAGRVVTLMVSLSPIHRPVMALHMRPVYTVLLGHGQRGLLGGRVPVPVAPVHAQKSDLWRPIRLNDRNSYLTGSTRVLVPSKASECELHWNASKRDQ